MFEVNLILNKPSSAYSETFISQHIKSLNARVVNVSNHYPLLPEKGHVFRNMVARIHRRKLANDLTRPRLPVLAEYGVQGAQIVDICMERNLDLIVHFHGYDAYRRKVLTKYRAQYSKLFDYARAIIVVSKHMKEQLVSLGASRHKIHHVTYGVDLEEFSMGDPAANNPTLFACGRFVEKKNPLTTIKAFAKIARECPDARLRFAGSGPLLESSKELVKSHGLNTQIEFLGVLDHQKVAEEMSGARAFVQHSTTAEDGDSEGTPVVILEAMASGLPVISTKHGGITDIVVDKGSGILVDENDMEGMATAMLQLLRDPELAREYGATGNSNVRNKYSMARNTAHLRKIILDVAE